MPSKFSPSKFTLSSKRLYFSKPSTYFLALLFTAISFSSQASLKQMDEQVSQQNYKQAYELGLDLFDDHAGTTNFDMLFGVSAQRTGHLDEAVFAFERVLMRNRNMQVAKFELARTHFMQGNLQTSRRYFTELLEATPQPPDAAIKRINWHLAAIDARESGKAVATSDAVNNFYVGMNVGYDSNPYTSTHKIVDWGFIQLTDGKVDSSSFHELYAGATRFQQQASNWGWFVGGRAGLEGFHNSKADDADNFSLGGQAGGVILGSDWRLTLPVQFQYLKRDDTAKNTVKVFALAADFNKRINSSWEYNTYGQLAKLSFSPSNKRDTTNISLGAKFTYKLDEQIKVYAGPSVTFENVDNDEHSYKAFGLRAGSSYSLSDKQFFDLNLNVSKANYDDEMVFFGKKRDATRKALKFSYKQRLENNVLFDLGIEHNNNSSDVDLYTYKRTRVSLGLRKEW